MSSLLIGNLMLIGARFLAHFYSKNLIWKPQTQINVCPQLLTLIAISIYSTQNIFFIFLGQSQFPMLLL